MNKKGKLIYIIPGNNHYHIIHGKMALLLGLIVKEAAGKNEYDLDNKVSSLRYKL
jgi:hypothetical protein